MARYQHIGLVVTVLSGGDSLPSELQWPDPSTTSPQSTELLTEPLTVCAPGVSAAIPCVATPAAELEDPARGCLTPPRRRHAGAASDDTNLVVSQRFGSRVVDIAVRRDAIGIADRSARGLRRVLVVETEPDQIADRHGQRRYH